MIVGIHQPHYFPWLGYLDKIAKSDIFVILNQVQLEKGSQMIRNRVLDTNGKIKYITISADTKDFLDREYRDIKVRDKESWATNQINALTNYYRKALFYDETMKILEKYFQHNFETLFEWVYESVKLSCNLLDINTQILLQSDVGYDKESKKSDLVMEICRSLSADTYLSGRGGSMRYLDKGKFESNGIRICFQNYFVPEYKQCQSNEFVPGLSILDALFNCGIEGTKKLFWDNMHKEDLGVIE